MIELVSAKAKQLRLKTISELLPQVIDTTAQKNWSLIETIGHLFDIELETRRQNRIALRFRQSKLNQKLTIDQFDFNHHGSRKRVKY